MVLWRRYGELGQELRPGTKAFRGGAEVYVIEAYPAVANEQLTAVGHGRHTGRWITIDPGARHPHTSRTQLVYAPAVLRRCGSRTRARAEAEELAELLDRIARDKRRTYHAAPHPDPCRCHAWLPLSPG